MSEERRHMVECGDCESVPMLKEVPYNPDMGYVLVCECEQEERKIDVTKPVSESNLTDPISGKWDNFNTGNPNR